MLGEMLASSMRFQPLMQLLTAGSHCVCRWAWPAYWLAQGTMFWALFVVGHDWCVLPSSTVRSCVCRPGRFPLLRRSAVLIRRGLQRAWELLEQQAGQ